MTPIEQQGSHAPPEQAGGPAGGPAAGGARALAVAFAAGLVAATQGAAGCECAPARSKPWRHAPDPAALAASQPSSEVVAAESARVAAQGRRSHTLRVHLDAQPRHLDPMLSPSEWTMRIAFDTVFETLIRYEPPAGGAGAGPGRYRPGLATTWRIAPGGREIRVDLRPDVQFHDGRKLTSIDAQFSLDAARNPRLSAPHLRRLLADVVAVELISGRSLRIRLARPSGYALRALARVPIMPSHVYGTRTSPSRGGPVVGTGPYRLAAFEDDRVQLAAFSDYWGERPAIADVEFVYEPDAARALTAAKRGELDIVPALIPAHYPEQASAPGIVARFAPLRLRPPRLRYLAFNASRPPLDDARVRHALALLIDRAALVRDVYDGLARPAPGPVWPGGPGDGAAPAPPEYDPARAVALLDEAGWRDGDGDGVREQGGAALRLSLLVLDGASPERDHLVSNLRRAGVVVEQRVGTQAVLKNRLRSGDFDLAFAEWRGSIDDDLTSLLETGGADNHGRFSSRQVDAALADVRAAWEPSARAPVLASLAVALGETWPLAPIVSPDPYGLVHRRVEGVVVWDGWIVLRALRFAEP